MCTRLQSSTNSTALPPLLLYRVKRQVIICYKYGSSTLLDGFRHCAPGIRRKKPQKTSFCAEQSWRGDAGRRLAESKGKPGTSSMSCFGGGGAALPPFWNRTPFFVFLSCALSFLLQSAPEDPGQSSMTPVTQLRHPNLDSELLLHTPSSSECLSVGSRPRPLPTLSSGYPVGATSISLQLILAR